MQIPGQKPQAGGGTSYTRAASDATSRSASRAFTSGRRCVFGRDVRAAPARERTASSAPFELSADAPRRAGRTMILRRPYLLLLAAFARADDNYNLAVPDGP